MAVNSDSWSYFGASVRGPAHARDGLPKQDAWLGHKFGNTSVIVVCDGLGSRPYSRHGAEQGCRSVISSVKQWLAVPNAPIGILIRLIHAIWTLRIYPYNESECASTCLFAVACENGRLYVAQLGDGLSLVVGDDSLHRITSANDDFSNETTGLGIAHKFSDWKIFESSQSGISSVLLASDGIADDLDKNKLEEFSDFVLSSYSLFSPRERWRMLSRDLRNWSVPYHSDDKTLAIMWRKEMKENEL